MTTKLGGSLTIVGTGIKAAGHATLEAKAHMEQAEKLLFLVADPATGYWLSQLNSSAESMQRFYGEGKDRLRTYLEIAEYILSFVRNGTRVCAAFYGHPGVFVFPSHEAIKRARAEGYRAEMLPGISAEDCLFADIGIDPGSDGCQSFEATDFLVYRRKFDPSVGLILWQIAVIGELGYRTDRICNTLGLKVLAEELGSHYGADYKVLIYEASQYATCKPQIDLVTISELGDATVSPIATLYVPPKASVYLDVAMARRLELPLPLGETGT